MSLISFHNCQEIHLVCVCVVFNSAKLQVDMYEDIHLGIIHGITELEVTYYY